MSKLTAQATKVALGPSRALTSYARRYYEEHYRGRWRFAQCLFAFDMGLLLSAMVLVGIAIHYASVPTPTSGLALRLSAPSIRTGTTVPLSVTVRSVDGLPHQNVRLRWHLSSGTQLLQANPSLSQEGVTYLGTVFPGQEMSSHIVARFFLPPGSDAEFTFSLISSEAGGEREFVGVTTRHIEGSVLSASVPDEFLVEAVADHGIIIPLRIENSTTESLPSAALTFKKTNGHALERIELGDLQPQDTRWVYVPVDEKATGTVQLAWSIGAAGRELSSGSWEASVVKDLDFPQVEGKLVSHPGSSTTIPLTNVSAPASFIIVHPYRSPEVQTVDVKSGEAEITVDVPSETRERSIHEWLVAPRLTQANGQRVLGPTRSGVITGSFPFSTRVRYYSSAGDQLGVGPHPPQVGKETRYWVFWTVGPIDNELRNVSVETTLPPGVEATGNISAPEASSFSVNGRRVSWKIPRVGPAPEATGETRGQATFGFEIRTTPSLADVGAPLPLVATSTAEASDVQTSVQFEAVERPKDSTLEEGASEVENGAVLPSIEP